MMQPKPVPQEAQKFASPLISVTIPFFNSGQFLSDAIESVLVQTHTNWELLLVDDGSTDNSTLIAKKFAALYPERIRYLEHSQHQHRGLASSRNLGLFHSTGEYIAQLDSDDIWSTTHLEDQGAIIASYPQVAMIYGPMRIWNSWLTSRPVTSDWIQQFTIEIERVVPPPQLIPALLSGWDDPQGVIMRRVQVETVGGYETAVRFYADTSLHCKLAIKYPIYISKNCTYWYRQHDNSYCGAVRATGQVANERMQFLQWFKSYVMAEDIRDARIHSGLNYAIWKSKHPKIERCLELPFRIRRSVTRQFLCTISDTP